MKTTTGNKRLDATFRRAVETNIGGGYWLMDCYNNAIHRDIACAVTTRVNAASDKYVLEVYEESDSDKCDQ